MIKKFAISALGELLIDFTFFGISESGMDIFERNPGGAPANVLAVASKFGLKTAFIGAIGKDMHGKFLEKTLQNAQIDTSGLKKIETAFTTLAFVNLNAKGERSFSFARKPGADTQLKTEDLNKKVLQNSQIFHIGSLSLTDQPIRKTTFDAIKIAKRNGSIISYDPNYRELLWKNRKTAIKRMRSILPFADFIKISEEEIELLTDEKTPESAGKFLNKIGVACAIITLGENGAIFSFQGKTQMVKSFKTNVVDSTGAGDSFFGGFLYAFLQSRKNILELNLKEITEFVRFGNAVAALCVRKRGAIPAMPSLDEVKRILEIK